MRRKLFDIRIASVLFGVLALVLGLVPTAQTAEPKATISQAISITVDPSVTLDQLITQGHYDLVDPWVRQYLTLSVSQGAERKEEAFLFSYDVPVTSDYILTDMESQGFRPATARELLSLSAQHKELQENYTTIVAFGTAVLVHGGRRVACLFRGASQRGLTLRWYGGGWYRRCRFLAFRK